MRTAAILLALPAVALALTARKPDIVVRQALYPRQSTTPCTYDCNDTDLNENKLQDQTLTGTVLVCDYGMEICDYDTTNNGQGVIVNDPNCPSFADSSCQNRRAIYRRENNYTAMLRRTAAREEAQRAEREAKRAAHEAEQFVKEAKRATELAKRASAEAERAAQEAKRTAQEAAKVNKS